MATTPPQANWHAMDAEEVIRALETSPQGLSEEEAKRRLAEYGFNELKEEERPGVLQIFVDQFKDFLIIILLAATALSFGMWLTGYEESPVDAIVILAIVISCAVLGTLQEYRAEKALEALKRMAAPAAMVMRGEKETEVPSREIVPGDIVLLATGDKVPADGRLIQEMNLQTDEAPLTGESIPVRKSVETLAEDVYVADRKNIVFTATVVTYGRGRAIVTSTGMNTEFGKIAGMLQTVEAEATPLEKRLDAIGKFLGWAMLGICGGTAALFALRAYLVHGEIGVSTILTIIMWGVALAVAAVPEALPAVVTGGLAIGVSRMAKKNAIVRRLPAVETLGSCTVICSDKTGTLTKNEMTVRRVYTDGQLIEVTGVGYEPKGEFYASDKAMDPKGNTSLQLLSRVAALCSDARLMRSGESSEGGWYISGDPTEGALVVAAAKAGVLQEEANKEFPRIGEIPFSSERKRMTTVHPVDGENFAYMKGAPEIVLERCTHILKGGKEEVLTDEVKKEILMFNERMASDALRILGMAYRKLPSTMEISEETIAEEAVEHSFVFVGLMGMIDPPREEAINGNKLCEDAGIKTVMITGDHKLTAVAVAKEIGMMKPDSIVLTGSELEEISDEEFEKIVEDVAVYARVSPVHKTRIVQALKKKGQIVAMTGDGVNDAPALKNADIGVAMGITGTDVTKEASDMVLADDNFATIVNAVEEGRSIFDNIKKYLIYLLSCNAAEMAIMLIAGLLNWPLPLLTAQLLWVNLTTDGLPALALGVDPAEPDIMARPPRDPKESVFTSSFKFYLGLTTVVITFAVLTPFYLIGSATGWSEYGTMKAQTAAFAVMVFSELARAYTCRSERYPVIKVGMFRNRFLNWAILSSVLMQLAVIQVPALDVMFHTVELSLLDWAMIIPLALTTFVVLELSKVFAPKVLKSLR